MAGGMPVRIGSAASVVVGTATGGRAAGAAAVQLGGTDNAPTPPALPRLADAVVPGSTWPASTPVAGPPPPAAANAGPTAPPPPEASAEPDCAPPAIPNPKSTAT